MTNGLRDLFYSERGTWCLLIVALTTVALFMGRISSTEWLAQLTSLTAILVASKTVTTAIETRELKEPQIPRAVATEKSP